MIPPSQGWLIDIAAGTGDIGFGALAKQKKLKALLYDPNHDMIAIGESSPQAGIALPSKARFFYARGDGCALPLADESINHATMAFGIRNIQDKDRAFQEVFRVLKPSARFLCLEFGSDITPFLRFGYHLYSRLIIPKLAHYIHGDAAPYHYLTQSISAFPKQDQIAQMIEDAGFYKTRFINMMGGIAVIYSGWKI